MAASPCCKLTKAKLEFVGEPIPIEFRADLRAGTAEVHASTYLHHRLIVLDTALRRSPRECERILAHEIFHFVWWKAPSIRSQYARLIGGELAAGARGEMGWSAEWRKLALRPTDLGGNTRRFREYLCESFCDSCASLLVGIARHPEITLTARSRRGRQSFFEANLAGKRLKI